MISTVTDLMAESLFASDLQPSEQPDTAAINAAISATLLRHGVEGCAAVVAAEYGDHPETAVARMRWCRERAGDAVAVAA
ncbi:hypothetical protein [Pilimelia columellifera]|uniref:Uncharacterized protein n=1 Tax=Pilimelia columellifera subsp. columellifera TaxID=706583 RepID=A0ABN3NNV4_9ACTN